MQFVMFTKALKSMSLAEMIDTVKALGLDGLDLAVRDGCPVNPANVAQALPAAVRECASAGLTIPMVSTATGLVDPEAPEAEAIYAACAQAGCSMVKIGYWHYRFPGYWEQVSEARMALAGFARLSERYRVKTAVHTHSGSNLAANCAMAMQLVEGLDPSCVGIYVDPGHLALDGEQPEMGIDMVANYLCALGVKDCRHVSQPGPDQPNWKVEWVPLREGLVQWRSVFEALKKVAFDGPVSFHCEYKQPLETLLAWTRDDIAYLRALTG